MPALAGAQNFQRRRWLTAYAPLVIWVFVVLGLGSSLGSMNETSRIIRPLLEFLFPSSPPDTITVYHGYIRKLAHITEYAVLAFLAARAFSVSAIAALKEYRFGFAVLVVLLVASLDEFHQSFESTRTGTVWDVALNLAGGAAMAAILKIVHYRRSRTKRRF